MSGIEIKIIEEDDKVKAYKEMDKQEEKKAEDLKEQDKKSRGKKSRRPQRTG
jgi:hypothetical protein